MLNYCFWKDKLFLISSLIYFFNTYYLKHLIKVDFFQNYLNDILLIPCALPPLIYLYVKLKLRNQKSFPTTLEVFSFFIFSSFVFECLGPKYLNKGVADYFDILAYAIGGIISNYFWNKNSKLLLFSKTLVFSNFKREKEMT